MQDIISATNTYGVKENVTQKYPWAGWQIALLDAILVWVSFLLSYYLRYQVQFLRPVDEVFYAPFRPYIIYTLLFMLWVLTTYNSARLYVDRRDRSLVNEIFHIVNGASNASVVVMALSFLLRPLVFSRLMLLQAAIIFIILMVLSRILIRVIRNTLHQRGIGIAKVLVVGVGDVGRHVIRTVVAQPNLGYRLVGFVDDNPERGSRDLGRVTALGNTRNLEKIINEQEIDLVIVTLPWSAQRQILEIVRHCERKNVAVRTVPDLFQLNMSQVKVEMLGGVPMLGVRHDLRVNRVQLIAKRVMDIFFTILMFPVVLPIMLITAIAIKLDSDGPIFYFQERVGFNHQKFKMIKFRSMIINADQLHEQVVRPNADDPEGYKRGTNDWRITRVGRFIRRTSIDELPQLFNILRGDMSLVGPRPALEKEVELYQPWHRQRLMVRPGLTGLWQASGRSDIPFEEKCLLDIYYIENWSLGLDLQIILQTAPQALFGKGAY